MENAPEAPNLPKNGRVSACRYGQNIKSYRKFPPPTLGPNWNFCEMKIKFPKKLISYFGEKGTY